MESGACEGRNCIIDVGRIDRSRNHGHQGATARVMDRRDSHRLVSGASPEVQHFIPGTETAARSPSPDPTPPSSCRTSRTGLFQRRGPCPGSQTPPAAETGRFFMPHTATKRSGRIIAAVFHAKMAPKS